MKNILLHLRLPFSYFLLPVFIFGIAQSKHIDIFNSVILFITLHFLIYPASNAYNSYMDKDVGSIGGLKNPPPVSKGVYLASIVLDVVGLLMSLLINIKMLLLILVYISVSKAYSWGKIRLKKYSIIGWLSVIIFQGGYTFLLVSMASENNFTLSWFNFQKIEGIVLSTMLIGAYYPLTQIYQHDEDSQRGDFTISYRLGIQGTFIFSVIMFLISFVIAYHYFNKYFDSFQFYIFGLCLTPAIIYFLYWFIKAIKNKKAADFTHTMRMTFLSSTCLLIAFMILFYLNHYSKYF